MGNQMIKMEPSEDEEPANVHSDDEVHTRGTIVLAQRSPKRLPYILENNVKVFEQQQQVENDLFMGFINGHIKRHRRLYYLVFFVDGHVQYISDTKIRLNHDQVAWNGIHQEAKHFFKYLVEADHAVHHFEEADAIKIELNGEWKWATVEVVYKSLIKVEFLANGRFEWLFMGSPRIQKVWRMIHNDRRFNALVPISTISHVSTISIDQTTDELPQHVQVRKLIQPRDFGWERLLANGEVRYIFSGQFFKNYCQIRNHLMMTRSPLSIDCFTFDVGFNSYRAYDSIRDGNRVLVEDISNGLEALPIRVVGSPFDTLPPQFQYTSKILLTDDEVPKYLLNPHREVCCDCEDDCADKTKCRCWIFSIERFHSLSESNVSPHSFGYQFKRLYDVHHTGLFECHQGCKCTNQCLNRVAQQPIGHQLEVFKTENCGWGVRCLNDIPNGAFVCSYFGTMITNEVADDRVNKAGGDKYLFDCSASPGGNNNRSRNSSEDDGLERSMKINYFPKSFKNIKHSEQPEPFVIDGGAQGNVARFFNHSCEPNMFIQSVYVDTHDTRFPRISFFTDRLIVAGEELTIDYNYKVDSIPHRVLYCQCDSTKCRGRLL